MYCYRSTVKTQEFISISISVLNLNTHLGKTNEKFRQVEIQFQNSPFG